MEIGLKWVHMGQKGLILRLVRGLWLPIIFKPLLTPKRVIRIQKIFKQIHTHAPEILSIYGSNKIIARWCGMDFYASIS